MKDLCEYHDVVLIQITLNGYKMLISLYILCDFKISLLYPWKKLCEALPKTMDTSFLFVRPSHYGNGFTLGSQHNKGQ